MSTMRSTRSGTSASEMERDTTTERVADDGHPVGEHRVLEDGGHGLGVLGAPPRFGWRWRGPEPAEVEADGGDRRPGRRHHRVEIGVRSAPPV